MAYIDKNKIINSELEVKLTDLGKRYLVDKIDNLHKPAFFNLGDSDVNYNVKEMVDVPAITGDEFCLGTTKYNKINYEVFRDGFSSGFGLANTNSLGRLVGNASVLNAFTDAFNEQRFSFLIRLKVPTNSSDLVICDINSVVSLGNGVRVRISTLNNLSILRIEFQGIFFNDFTNTPKFYSGEINYINTNIIPRDREFNLIVSKGFVFNDLMEISIDDVSLSDRFTSSRNIVQTTTGNTLPRQALFNSAGNAVISRILMLNRELSPNEKPFAHEFTNSFGEDAVIDFRFQEGNGNTITDSGDSNNIFDIIDLEWQA